MLWALNKFTNSVLQTDIRVSQIQVRVITTLNKVVESQSSIALYGIIVNYLEDLKKFAQHNLGM